jgi:peptidoglycan/xylan/chitin deacetylase (PgdA/CDA1 family)
LTGTASPQSAPRLKRVFAGALHRSGLLRIDLAARGPSAVIAINYHGTPAWLSPSLERHFEFFRANFECLGEDDLLRFLAGSLRLRRPGVVISFDDGLQDHAETASPLLERFGLRGWFMIPGGFLDEPVSSQAQYFRAHVRGEPNEEHPPHPPARAMTWEMARSIGRRGHVLGCHTWSHRPLDRSASAETIQEEIVLAKEKLESRLGRPVRTFAWARGRVGDYSARAHRVVAERFQLAFMAMSRAVHVGADPLTLHRFNVEASFSLPLVRFQMSRFNEIAFALRRRAVQATIRTHR